MTNEEINAFINELKNYRFYQERIKRLDDLIDTCFYWLSGVKGIQYDKLPSTYNPELTEENRLRILEEIELHRNNKEETETKIKELDRVISLLEEDVQRHIKDIYIKGMTYGKVAYREHMSQEGVRKRIKKELRKVVY